MDQPFLASELEQGWGIPTAIPGGEKVAAPPWLSTLGHHKIEHSQLKAHILPAQNPEEL